MYVRLRINLIQKPASILLCEHACEAPWLLLQRLYILNLRDQYIAWLCSLNVERPREVMHLGQVHIADIVCGVIVSNLPTSPVYALDLDDLVVLDGTVGGVVWMPAVL